jgi:hypothetical protein
MNEQPHKPWVLNFVLGTSDVEQHLITSSGKVGLRVSHHSSKEASGEGGSQVGGDTSPALSKCLIMSF